VRGDGNSTTDAVTNVPPYLRLGFEPHWGMVCVLTPGLSFGGTRQPILVSFQYYIFIY
jgi:hypothetical protein